MAANAILAEPVEEPAHWLLVLIEEIEAGIAQQHNNVVANEMLDDLSKAIQARLHDGMW
jgi:hypothetical protein